MDVKEWSTLAEVANHLLRAAGIVAGGAWAVWRFDIFRKREAALAMSLNCASTSYGAASTRLATFGIVIRNTGAVKIQSRAARNPAYPRSTVDAAGASAAVADTERLRYGVDLLIRPIADDIPVGMPVRWFPDTKSRSPRDGDIELDLVSGYERNGTTEFWIEPGEVHSLGTAVVLSPRLYLALLRYWAMMTTAISGAANMSYGSQRTRPMAAS